MNIMSRAVKYDNEVLFLPTEAVLFTEKYQTGIPIGT